MKIPFKKATFDQAAFNFQTATFKKNPFASDSQRDTVVFKRRVWVAALLILLGLSVLIARYAFLQIVNHEQYVTQADNNRIKLISAPPSRGAIYDRNGILLAENQPVFTAVISPDEIDDPERTLQLLAPIFALTPEDIEEAKKALKKSRNQPVTIKIGLSEQQVAQFSERRPFFHGVSIQSKLTRAYPYDDLFAHVIGYVGRISDADSKKLDKQLYAGTDLIGKTGIEKQYEDLLLGKPGYQSIETNAYGDVIRKLDTKPPVAGNDLYLSLDYGLQKKAHDLLDGRRGAVIAINPQTGEVLAFVSNPSYDPNPFVTGISSKDYKALRDDPDQPLYNRALQGLYPPGSTIKPFEGMGFLHYKIMTWDSTIFDPGYFSIPGDSHRFRDWKKSGHGTVNLHKSITESVDTYYYKTSYQLGIDKLHDWMTRFNFGKKTGIDLPGEKAGVYPSSQWKMDTYKKPWSPGETISVSIGQGYFIATPLQIANATAMLANGGQHLTPHLLRKTTGAVAYPIANRPDSRIEYNGSPQDWTRMQLAMEDTVKHGTARRVYTNAYRMGGKTGTAQVKSIAQGKRYNEAALDQRHWDHGWFESFAPVENPQIAIAVLVENGRHGGSVAPIAREMTDYWLLERQKNPILPPKPDELAKIRAEKLAAKLQAEQLAEQQAQAASTTASTPAPTLTATRNKQQQAAATSADASGD